MVNQEGELMKYERKALFDFLVERVREVARKKSYQSSQAFPIWFSEMFINHPKILH